MLYLIQIRKLFAALDDMRDTKQRQLFVALRHIVLALRMAMNKIFM